MKKFRVLFYWFTTKMFLIKNKIKKLFDDKVFNTKTNTIKFVALLIFTVLFLIQIYIIIFNNSFYNNISDDIVQYFVIMEGFIRSVKEGSVSFFDLNNYFGASIFSNLYYVPLDFFTLITLIMSYVMPTALAISSTELIKILTGVVLFAIYLGLKDYKTRTIFWASLIYFVNGGTVSFMNFPAFLSLTAYLPLSLIIIHYFFKKKYWVVPLFVLMAVFYNFYLAYMLLAFTSFAYLIEYFKSREFKIGDFLLEGTKFLSLLLLGVLMSSVLLLPAITFISEETARSTVTFEPWIVDLKFIELKLFPPEVYIRYFAKLFAPHRPVSFRGFLGDYKIEHVSTYVTLIGFVIMLYVFFIKEKVARVYKIVFIFLLIFMIFPIFSSILSGTIIMSGFSDDIGSAYPYNRWLDIVPIIMVMVIAYVIDKFDFKTFKRKYLFISGIFTLLLGLAIVYYYYKNVNTENLDDFVYRMLTVDKILMMIAIGLLVIGLIFAGFKKYKVLKLLIFVEVVIAVGYMFVSGFSSTNKLETFKEMNEINNFINENISEEEFTRVYVDIDKFDVQDRNYNQMTSYPTNTRIFHSWSDSETDSLGYLLFNTNEKQSKKKMNYYSYYLSAFLGYQYILTDANENSFSNNENFELIADSDNYKLYYITNANNFYIYDSYLTFDDFKYFNQRNPQIIAERVFLMAAIVDSERYRLRDYDLDILTPEEIVFDSDTGKLPIFKGLDVSYEENIEGLDSIARDYYVYDNLGIDYSSGEITLRDNSNPVDNYGEVFYLNTNNKKKSCDITTDSSNKTSIACGQFFYPIEKIYVEKTSALLEAPSYIRRLERALSRSSYLVYDIIDLDINYDEDLLFFDFTSYDIEKSFIVNEAGEEIHSVNGLFFLDSKPERIFIYKDSELYKHDNLYNLYLNYTIADKINASDIANNDMISNKYLAIENGKIDLSYNYISTLEGNHIVTIPVTYSDDWQFTSNQKYDKISVSGGFLGIIIPEGTETVDISLKFIPKNIENGAYLSLAGILIYLTICSVPFIKKHLKRRD
ncbi:MAG: YfhO family protein [Bacillota bacterium]